MTTKIAIIQTHPIQHFCPQFASYSGLGGIDLEVVFETKKGLEPYFDKQFNKTIRWDGIDLSGFKHHFLNNLKIEQLLNTIQPEVVVVYGYAQPIQKKAYRWAKLNTRKIFYVSDSTSHRKQNSIIKNLKALRYRSYFKNVDICLSVGDSNEAVYRKYDISNSKMVRTSFPIDILNAEKVFKNKKEINTALRNKYNISNDTLVISTIGKIEAFKRQIDIINLLIALELNNIKAHAFICGSGDEVEFLKEESKKLTSNTVSFTGFVMPSELLHILSASDFYIHPSSREAHSLSISEAIYFGCPVLLTDACGSYGPTDDVQPGKNGFVYPVGDIESLVDKISYLYNNPEIRSSFSKASIKISRQNQKLAHGEALKSAINIIRNK